MAYAEQAAAGVNIRVPHRPMGADGGNSAAASEALMDARSVAGSMDEMDDEVRGCGGS